MRHKLDYSTDDQTVYLTLGIDSIETTTIDNFSRYLVDNIHQLFGIASDHDVRRDYWFYAVRLVLGEKYTISEQSFWSLVVRCVAEPEKHIAAYIDKLCELTAAGDTPESVAKYGSSELIWSTDQHPIGSYPLIEYLDWQYEDRYRFERSPVGDILEPFLKFLAHCDMDHETWQDDYISRILTKYKHAESEAELGPLLTLLHFRLFNGQSTIIAREKNREYLHRFLCYKAGLKKVIDRIVPDEELEEVFSYEESLYLKLCACVYGTNEKLTNDVMDYVRAALDEELFPVSKYHLPEIEEIRAEADAFLESQYVVYELYSDKADSPYRPHDFDTGFHRYVIKEQRWHAIKT